MEVNEKSRCKNIPRAGWVNLDNLRRRDVVQEAIHVQRGTLRAARDDQHTRLARPPGDERLVAAHIFDAENDGAQVRQPALRLLPDARANAPIFIPTAQPALRGDAHKRARKALRQRRVYLLRHRPKVNDCRTFPGRRHIGRADWRGHSVKQLAALAALILIFKGCRQRGRQAVNGNAGQCRAQVEIERGAGHDCNVQIQGARRARRKRDCAAGPQSRARRRAAGLHDDILADMTNDQVIRRG